MIRAAQSEAIHAERPKKTHARPQGSVSRLALSLQSGHLHRKIVKLGFSHVIAIKPPLSQNVDCNIEPFKVKLIQKQQIELHSRTFVPDAIKLSSQTGKIVLCKALPSTN